jgi:tagatose 1,6-diphosphate aldolase GatY/KbaY
MPLTSAARMAQDASAGGYAVGAFNVTSMIQMQAVVEAAVEQRAPVIIQTSVTPARFIGPGLLVAACRTLAESAPVPVCLHLDHCTDAAYCVACARAGYTNVMIDASQRNLEENIASTRLVVTSAHDVGDVTVEGELGTVGGVEDQVRVVENSELLCDPRNAVDFVRQTGVDLFAPAIGTAHGVYATADPRVDLDRLGRIREALLAAGLRVPLVIHGGTGLPPHTVRRLIALGGAKFNVSTELKHVLIDTTREYIRTHPQEYDPGRIDKAVKEATRKSVAAWMDLLGCAGKA